MKFNPIIILIMILLLTSSVFSSSVVSVSKDIQVVQGSSIFSGQSLVLANFVGTDASVQTAIFQIPAGSYSQGQTSENIELDLSSMPEQYRFQLQDNNKVIQTFSVNKIVTKDGSVFDGCSAFKSNPNSYIPNAYRDTNGYYYYFYWAIPFSVPPTCEVYYLQANAIYRLSDMVNGKTIVTSQWTVKKDGAIAEQKTVSNDNNFAQQQYSTYLANNNVYVLQSGLLSSGVFQPNVLGNLVINKGSTFYVVNSNLYSQYQASLNSIYSEFRDVDNFGKYRKCYNTGDYSGCLPISNTNSIYNQLLGSQATGDLRADLMQMTSATTSQITFQKKQSSPIYFSNYAVYVKGQFIGLNFYAGEPSLISLTQNGCYNEGEQSTGTITATIKNIGNAQGSFTLGAVQGSCSNGFSVYGIDTPFTLNAGQQTTKNLVMLKTNFAQTNEQGTCNICMTENTKKTTSCKTITLCAKENPKCIEGTKYADFNIGNIYICKNGQYELLSTCDLTKNFIRGTDCIDKCTDADYLKANPNVCSQEDRQTCKPVVALPSAIGGATIIPNLSNECLKIQYLSLIFVVIALIGGLIMFALSFSTLSNKKFKFDKTTNMVISISLGVLITALVFFILNILWWLIIILAIAGAILYLVLKILRIL